MSLELAWIPATLLAGLLQAWRTAVQHKLRAQLTINGAGLARYVYGLPLVLLVLAGYLVLSGAQVPPLDATFVAMAAVAAIAQILATNLLIMAFSYRNFVVGTAFSKTETVQAALFGWIILGERISLLIGIAITVGAAGVLVLAFGGRQLRSGDLLGALVQPAALSGLTSGGLFAMTAVFIRRAALHLDAGQPFLAALVTLTAVVSFQSITLGGYVAWRELETLRAVGRSWRTSGQVGLLAGLGSTCLFSALAIAPVALVRVVAQIEVVFTLAFAALYLREPFHRFEATGLLLVASGVILALSAALT